MTPAAMKPKPPAGSLVAGQSIPSSSQSTSTPSSEDPGFVTVINADGIAEPTLSPTDPNKVSFFAKPQGWLNGNVVLAGELLVT